MTQTLPAADAPGRRPVAMYVNSFGGGGAEKNTVMIANGFIAQGLDVDVLVERDEGSYRPLLSSQAKIVDLGATEPFTLLYRLYRYIRSAQPRYFFAHLEKTSLLSLVAGVLAGYRKVIPVLHVNLDSYAKIDHTVRRQFLRALLAVFYRLAPRIISVSEGCKDSLAPLLGTGRRIITVYNGFELDKLRAASREPVTLPPFADKTKPIFLGCGRLSEQKNFAVLIKAFAEVRRQRDSALVILGEGPQRAELEKLARDLGVAADVHMPGFQPNPFAWFNKCDAFVLTSKSEGLANVLIEALVAGAQIVSADCPSGPPEILQNGKYGLIVPVDDVSATAQAMLRMIDPEQPPLATQAEIQAYLDKSFAYARMIDDYRKVGEIVEAEASSG